MCVCVRAYLFERFPHCLGVGADWIAESLQGGVDDLPVHALEVTLVGRLRGLTGNEGQVVQHPQQLHMHKHTTVNSNIQVGQQVKVESSISYIYVRVRV